MALVLACHRLCSRHGKAASGRLALSSRVELVVSLILLTSSNLQLLVLLSLTTLRLRRQFEYCQANLSLRLLSSFVFGFAFVCSLPLAFGCTLVACGRPQVRSRSWQHVSLTLAVSNGYEKRSLILFWFASVSNAH